MNSIVFSTSSLRDPKIRVARFCQSDRDVRDAIEEVGAEPSMFVPLDDPFQLAELLQRGFSAQLRQKRRSSPAPTSEEIKAASRSLRELTEQERKEVGL